MPSTPNVYEKQSDGTLLLLTLKGEFQGFDLSSNPIYGPLQISNIGDPSVILVPDAPSIVSASSSLTSRTASHVVWTAPPDNGGPAITNYHIYRSTDGASAVEISGSPVSAATFSINETGLPTSTAPEKLFAYTVRAQNADGLGPPSNQLILQWNSGVAQTPVAPLTLVRHNLTTSQIDLSWTVVTDATVDKQGIFEGSTLIIDNIDPSALAYQWVNLVAGSRHTNVNIKRHNTFGWSPASPTLTFTVPTIQVVHDVHFGVPLNDEYDAGRIQNTQWPAIRCYDFSAAIADFNASGCRTIALTDSASGFETGQSTSATALRNHLINFYEGTGSAARANVETHFATENETDNKHKTGSLTAAYINTVALCRNVIYEETSPGVRRFPKASMWVDMTQNQIKSNGAGARFKVIAQYLDGFGCSMYPPGRQSYSGPGLNGSTSPSTGNVIFTAYAQYVDPVMTVIADWATTGGASGGPSPLRMFGTWEIGIPIDHPWRDGGGNDSGHTWSASFPSGEPTDLTNFTIRPRYLAGGIDSTGHDWYGFLQYTFDKLDAMGISMREQLYWNQQSNSDIPNPFFHDQHDRAWNAGQLPAPWANDTGSGSTRANPDSEAAWRNWTPGSRLPNG